MKRWRAELLLLALSAIVLLSAWRRVDATRSPAQTTRPGNALGGSPRFSARDTSSAREDVAWVIAHDPFRLSNRPSRVRHGDLGIETQQARYRPELRLAAVIGGPPWRGLVVGIPGRNGATVVGEGETIDSLTVVRITRDTVRLRGPDTTWQLVIPRGRP